ncbi:MAG: ribosome small subunit-dependent GTPase A [Lachnospiraceae bacterium]|nr:ribosome small subunit-dependent GTPase A [Lachnospiraceae bacterium]
MAVQGKIIKSIAGFYEVHTGEEVYRCRAKGLFRALHEKPLVGDDVEIEITDTVSVPKEGHVIRLLPRKNDLIRPNVANVDQALLLFAVTNPAPSYNMLDRFLIIMHRKNLPAILCFNKLDIAAKEQLDELRDTYEACGCRVLFISTRDKSSLAPLKDILLGKTTVITGPSGAGKSSLINTLCPHADMVTGELSKKIQRGRNTTRHVVLLQAGPSTYLVDTPGFTSLYLQDLQAEDVKNYYPEFTPLQPKCRFQGCNHISEPDCAVKSAVKAGQISRIRYQNYTEIFAELKERKPVYGHRV